jgi:hypothetical protein
MKSVGRARFISFDRSPDGVCSLRVRACLCGCRIRKLRDWQQNQDMETHTPCVLSSPRPDIADAPTLSSPTPSFAPHDSPRHPMDLPSPQSQSSHSSQGNDQRLAQLVAAKSSRPATARLSPVQENSCSSSAIPGLDEACGTEEHAASPACSANPRGVSRDDDSSTARNLKEADSQEGGRIYRSRTSFDETLDTNSTQQEMLLYGEPEDRGFAEGSNNSQNSESTGAYTPRTQGWKVAEVAETRAVTCKCTSLQCHCDNIDSETLARNSSIEHIRKSPGEHQSGSLMTKQKCASTSTADTEGKFPCSSTRDDGNFSKGSTQNVVLRVDSEIREVTKEDASASSDLLSFHKSSLPLQWPKNGMHHGVTEENATASAECIVADVREQDAQIVAEATRDRELARREREEAAQKDEMKMREQDGGFEESAASKAERIVADARAQAAQIVAEAAREIEENAAAIAKHIVADARAQAAQIVAEATQDRELARREREEAAQEREVAKHKQEGRLFRTVAISGEGRCSGTAEEVSAMLLNVEITDDDLRTELINLQQNAHGTTPASSRPCNPRTPSPPSSRGEASDSGSRIGVESPAGRAHIALADGLCDCEMAYERLQVLQEQQRQVDEEGYAAHKRAAVIRMRQLADCFLKQALTLEMHVSLGTTAPESTANTPPESTATFWLNQPR